MNKLNALDRVWLDLEGPGPPIATGLVGIMDGPAPSVRDMRRMVSSRLSSSPGLQWVLRPGHGLHRPQWVDGGPPDLMHHVRSHRVPARSGALEEFVSGLMERRLDLDRPLWEIVVVRGLPDGRWAFVWRLHHAVADGQGSQAMTGQLLDVKADGSVRLADAVASLRPNARDLDTEPRPDRPTALDPLRSVADGLVSAARHLPEAAHLVADVAPRPPRDLTGELSERRRWVMGTADLAESKQAARAIGATVNDVVLGAVAAGYHALLVSRGDPVEGRRLRAVFPVSLRAESNLDLDNQVSLGWTDLPVGPMSLPERVEVIAKATAWQKEAGTPRIGGALAFLTDHLVPTPVQHAVVKRAGWLPGWVTDTLVTNVPGAPFPLYVLGRRMRLAFPIIPVDGHLRINVGIVSHDGTLCVGVTGDGVHAADVDVLRDGLVAALSAGA